MRDVTHLSRHAHSVASIREINRIFRTIQFTLHSVHNVCADSNEVIKICQTARQQFSELAPVWRRISVIIGSETVEKYRAHWRFACEQLVFLAAFAHWLETHQLITIEQASEVIGVGMNEQYAVPMAIVANEENQNGAATATASTTATPIDTTATAASSTSAADIGLDLDDYLQGLTALPKGLTRMCINCVRTGNYDLPQQISTFVSDLYSGFRLLNLRNDALRRKFDAIKYDVAKIEEIQYDCTVRGLGKKSEASASEPVAMQQ